MTPGQFQRILASVLAVVVAGALASPPVLSGALASWSGRVIDVDGVSPRPDAVVSLLDESGNVAGRSSTTRADGSFAIRDTPAGRYDLVIETSEGAYVSAAPVQLAPGANAPRALSLRPGAPGRDQDFGLGSGGSQKKWVKWAIAGTISALAIFAIIQVSEDDDEDPVSPF